MGRPGKVIVARAEHGKNLLQEIENIALKEKVTAAIVYLVGAVQGASIVAGPVQRSLPPEAWWVNLDDGHELLGIGTLFSDGQKPLLHLHASFGRGRESLTGCVRGNTPVYMVSEIIMLEILGTGAIRATDDDSGLKILDFDQS